MTKITKTETLRGMLARPRGAALSEICAATTWQSHTVRAAISGLRKAGAEIRLEADGEGGGGRRYRLASAHEPAPEPQESASSMNAVVVDDHQHTTVPDGRGDAALKAAAKEAGSTAADLVSATLEAGDSASTSPPRRRGPRVQGGATHAALNSRSKIERTDLAADGNSNADAEPL